MADQMTGGQTIEDSRQIFVFELDSEEYAINVGNVEEIIRAEEKKVTNVPNVPDFIRGIINVRGQVVPLMDLEKKFNLEEQENNFIVIVEIEDSSAGILVDDVQEVMRVERGKIKDAPKVLEKEIHADYIQEVAVIEDRMIIILDLEKGMKGQDGIAMEDLDEMNDEDEQEEEESEEVSDEDVEKMAEEKVKEMEKDESEEKDGSGSDNSGDSQDEDREDDSEEEFECDECGDTFDSKRGLASHKAQVH